MGVKNVEEVRSVNIIGKDPGVRIAEEKEFVFTKEKEPIAWIAKEVRSVSIIEEDVCVKNVEEKKFVNTVE
uniref:Uncharacterized protein n=1 Tax=Marseillevirus LCMAC101 TaxID=2506602 RepID=A0A481YUI8_9VIRU|nr:MAG: hypothetical protein LCMAC101_07610 [Marseillevirus LCMAC101]